MRFFLRLCDGAADLARWVATAMSMVMIAALLLQIFFRYVVGQALSGSEELALLMFAWVVLLLASVGVHDGFHVRLTVGLNLLPARARIVAERLIEIAIGVFGAFLTVSGWRYLVETQGQVSAAINYPIEILHSAGFVCGVLITLQAAGRLLRPSPAAAAGDVGV